MRRLEVADEIVAASCITRQLRSSDGPMPSAARGPDVLKEPIQSWLAAFPDLRWEVEAVVMQGERVVTWAKAHGTHSGHWLGIAPTGRRVAIQCVVLHRIAGEQIVEDWWSQRRSASSSNSGLSLTRRRSSRTPPADRVDQGGSWSRAFYPIEGATSGRMLR